MHSHSHSHGEATGSVLCWSLAATAAFVAVELVAGIRAHSLALVSDAGHNFTDALALALAWFGVYLESKPADEHKTYGYHRGGVLAAFVNALTLLALSAWILFESAGRLRHPEPVAAGVIMAVAALGLLVNGGIMLALRAARNRDVNIRSAFLHMLGDALGSLAIIGGGLAIRYTGWQRVDPVLSILIALLIVWTAWDIVRESLNILLEGLPRGMLSQRCRRGHAGGRRRARCPRPAHLVPGIEHARLELPRPDRGRSAFGQRRDLATAERHAGRSL